MTSTRPPRPSRPGSPGASASAGGSEGGFPGAAIIQRQLWDGTQRRRVGILPEGRQPAREHTEIQNPAGQRVGEVTSGGFGPSLNGPLAMGYAEIAAAAPGHPLTLIVRGKPLAGQGRPPALRQDQLQTLAKRKPMSALKYTKDHEWIRVEGDVGTVGITPYAQEQLGDVVFVELPEVGRKAEQGKEIAVVESVKAASEIFAPVSGEVVESNKALPDAARHGQQRPAGRRLVLQAAARRQGPDRRADGRGRL